MSINSRAMLSAVALAFATPVVAVGTLTRPAAETPVIPGVEVAQETALVLTDSQIRRLNHYCAQALEALVAFDDGGSASGNVDVLRQKVQRLVDAGERSGLDLIHTADYFEAYTEANSTATMPGAFLDGTGRFDARSLLSSVTIFNETHGPKEVDVTAIDDSDLAAVSSVAQRVSSAPAGTQAPLPVVTPPQPAAETPETPVGPVITADTPANVRAILERITVRGNQWFITVEPGDSLGQFSNALYGDTLQFQRIYEANLDKMNTPNVIEVGQELLLPHG